MLFGTLVLLLVLLDEELSDVVQEGLVLEVLVDQGLEVLVAVDALFLLQISEVQQGNQTLERELHALASDLTHDLGQLCLALLVGLLAVHLAEQLLDLQLHQLDFVYHLICLYLLY